MKPAWPPLALINDGEPDFGDEVRDGGISGAKLAKSEAMCKNETAERFFGNANIWLPNFPSFPSRTSKYPHGE